MENIRPKIYILPGWGDRLTDKAYKQIIAFAIAKGYKYLPIRVASRNRKFALGSNKSIKEIIRGIESQILQPAQNDIILGFSIGALMAYIIAEHIKFKYVILCSLSAVIGNELKGYDRVDVERIFSASQLREMAKMKYGSLKPNRAILLYGENESKILKNLSNKVGRRKGNSVIEIKAGEHELNQKYLKALKKVII